MILDGRVRGSIDQILGIVGFDMDEMDDGEERGSGACQVEEALSLIEKAQGAFSMLEGGKQTGR
jgi:hypothetical protein